ncbi:MAG TPA: YiiX/YebB-like N1pC/P60 family cysteine hydrolase [Caulobacteraceae bacterium]|nr:YiiX/YebB-like N1pC/P60 family cysteine hydrolase [Caulobacteraceae bacterium]
MAIADAALTNLPAQPAAVLGPRVRDGDLLLCSAHDPFSRLIAWSTRSPWTHVAIAFRWPRRAEIMVFECVQHIGVRAVPLASFLSQTSSGVRPYPGKIVLARHAGLTPAKRGERLEDMAQYAIDKLGDRFSVGEIAKIALRIIAGRFVRRMPRSLGPDDEFICSEFVARCYHAAGLPIAWDGLGFVAPVDLARDPQVRALARFRTT